MTTLWLLGALLGPVSAWADDAQRIVEVTSDTNTITYEISLLTDASGDLTGLAYSERGQSAAPFGIDALRAGQVLVRNKSGDTDVVTLFAPGLDAAAGGAVRVHYLRNGVLGRYRDFWMKFVRSDGRWHAVRGRSNRPFTRLHFESNRVFGKTIGIYRVRAW